MRLGIGLVAALGLASFPSAAATQPVIPPGNSAVNQYTEPFPTPGGSAVTTEEEGRSPAQALGTRNARQLERLGSDGRAAAALAAATAPVQVGTEGKPDSKSVEADEPGGSSALSEIVSQATGSSFSGGMGLLLLLVIVGAVAGSLIFLWRQKRQVT